MVSQIHAVLKIYPDSVSLYIPKSPIPLGVNISKKSNLYDSINPQVTDYLQKSIDRTHSKIRDYIMCNDFTWFFTLTVSPANCDRSDDFAVKRLLKTYFDLLRRDQPIKYLLVPERHKSGELHFHGLMSSPPILLPTGKSDSSGRLRYENPLASLIMGFNDWTEITDKQAISQYVRKYITKSLIEDPGKKRYYVSRNLSLPKIEYINPSELPDGIWDSMYDLDYAYFGNFGI